MSDESTYTTPVSAAFEMQRSAIKQSQQAVENGFEFQKRMNAAMLGNFDTTEDAQRQTVELAEAGIHNYLDAVEATVPGSAATVEQMRANVETQFESLYEAHAEAFDVAEGEFAKGVDTYDDMTAQYVEAMNEQLETLLESHADVEEQVLKAFEQAENQMEEMQAQMEAQGEEMQAQFQEQFEQFQAQIEEMQAQMEEVQQRTAESIGA
jgi:paraquat-inducible protein B